ncbi:flagellar biosynthesis anti-sigma factor FlgM [Ectothiorhodospiraceae bacterium 2226]|nr:flagellar biosynthesis anti-sigma factor FlgM [Ectothiorhodospiraceae bacterium 2226]
MASKQNQAIPFPRARNERRDRLDNRGLRLDDPPHDSACPPRSEALERAPLIDTVCVERLQKAINAGTYGFDATRVASKLVKFERQLIDNAGRRNKRAGTRRA